MCFEVEEGGFGKTINYSVEAPEGRLFKGGSSEVEFNDLLVEHDNTAYIGNFKLEYEKDV